MSSVLDVDLDFFGLLDDPVGELDRLIRWGGRPVDVVVERHHYAFRAWRQAVKEGAIDEPRFILHVDEHHDMLGEAPPVNFGNFMWFAMDLWPRCRVHWLVRDPIDSPGQWLSNEAWSRVRRRFTSGPRIPRDWPRPDLVSIATSPGFVEPALARALVERVGDHLEPEQHYLPQVRRAGHQACLAPEADRRGYQSRSRGSDSAFADRMSRSRAARFASS